VATCTEPEDRRVYYCTDANMNVTTLLAQDGSAWAYYVYDAYRNVTFYDCNWVKMSTPPYDNSILFAGYYRDEETGLYHVRNRTYHPALGRWMQRDPVGYQDGMSLYEYVGSNAQNRLDSRGLWSELDQYTTWPYVSWWPDGYSCPAGEPPSIPKPGKKESWWSKQFPWLEMDFVCHYAFGDGEAVNLADTGLLSELVDIVQGHFPANGSAKTSRRVEHWCAETAKIMDCCDCPDVPLKAWGHKERVGLLPKEAMMFKDWALYWSVGTTWVHATYYGEIKAAECEGNTVTKYWCFGRIDYSIDDMFEDVLDPTNSKPGNQDVWGCTPYPLRATWSQNFFRTLP